MRSGRKKKKKKVKHRNKEMAEQFQRVHHDSAHDEREERQKGEGKQKK